MFIATLRFQVGIEASIRSKKNDFLFYILKPKEILIIKLFRIISSTENLLIIINLSRLLISILIDISKKCIYIILLLSPNEIKQYNHIIFIRRVATITTPPLLSPLSNQASLIFRYNLGLRVFNIS